MSLLPCHNAALNISFVQILFIVLADSITSLNTWDFNDINGCDDDSFCLSFLVTKHGILISIKLIIIRYYYDIYYWIYVILTY